MRRLVVVAALFLACGDDDGAGGTGDAGTGDARRDDGGGGGTPLTESEILSACVNAWGCFAETSGVGNCFSKLGDYEELLNMFRTTELRCLAAAGGNCVTARACLGYTFTGGGCSPVGTSCVDNTSVSCNGTLKAEFDCTFAAPDATCVATTAQCGLGTCAGTATTCDGSRVVTCSNGVTRVDHDCARAGATCTTDVPVGVDPVCITPDAVPCSADYCDGDTLVLCEASKQLRVDCAARIAGATCIAGAFPRCGYAADCTPASNATCASATTFTSCMLGKSVTVDCLAMGFEMCTSGACKHPTFP